MEQVRLFDTQDYLDSLCIDYHWISNEQNIIQLFQWFDSISQYKFMNTNTNCYNDSSSSSGNNNSNSSGNNNSNTTTTTTTTTNNIDNNWFKTDDFQTECTYIVNAFENNIRSMY